MKNHLITYKQTVDMQGCLYLKHKPTSAIVRTGHPLWGYDVFRLILCFSFLLTFSLTWLIDKYTQRQKHTDRQTSIMQTIYRSKKKGNLSTQEKLIFL